MGRSFGSVRLGVRAMVERWERAVRVLDRDRKAPARTVIAFARHHASEGFFGCDSPLEAAAFSSLLEIKKCCTREDGHVDP